MIETEKCFIKPMIGPRGFKEVIRAILPDGSLKQVFVPKVRRRFELRPMTVPVGNSSDAGSGY